MDEWLVREVWRRAGGVCEYCRLTPAYFPVPFEIDHVIARQHRGPTVLGNLALACVHCNGHKGPNLAGIDPLTRKLTRLFNPRRHKWGHHFRWDGPVLEARTPIGRVTLYVLQMNAPHLVGLRQALLREGLLQRL